MSSDERVILQYSVEDAILMLLSCPVQGDFFAQFTIVQIMNRVAIAHLSIERAVKFLIKETGGSFEEVHDLRKHYAQLSRHDHESANFLERAFQAAVVHYRYNPNAANMNHLQSLERYLEISATNQAFQDVRYWELTQSLDDMLIGKIYLTIHIELLHALKEVLLEPNRPMETVADRVERSVRETIGQTGNLKYQSGTAKEHSVTSYVQWFQNHPSFKDALADAIENDFKIGDDFAEESIRKVYQALLESNDHAVKYFAFSLDVLPKQSRDVIPDVEWLGPESERRGKVITPGGTSLGIIERHVDGLWSITAFKSGPIRPSAKAETKTDALCYLASTMSRPAQMTVDGKRRSIRVVGDNRELLAWDTAQSNLSEPSTNTITSWDRDHGILEGQEISIVTKRVDTELFTDKIEGEVLKVQGSEVTILGRHITVINPSN